MRRKGGKKGTKETEQLQAGMKQKQDNHISIN